MAWVTALPGGPGDLRYGYTLADVNRIAKSATLAAGGMASDVSDRLDTAWSAIVEHLYAAEQPPPEHDLWHAGRHAIWSEIQGQRRSHGADRRDRDAELGSMPGFRRYWWTHASTVPSCEERVIERHALVTIWSELPTGQRQALLALAAHGSAEAGAQALNIGHRAMLSRLNAGRRRFRELWHEGETPSQKWRLDAPPRPARVLRGCGHPSTYHRHRRRGEPVDEACRRAWTEYQAERARMRSAEETRRAEARGTAVYVAGPGRLTRERTEQCG